MNKFSKYPHVLSKDAIEKAMQDVVTKRDNPKLLTYAEYAGLMKLSRLKTAALGCYGTKVATKEEWDTICRKTGLTKE